MSSLGPVRFDGLSSGINYTDIITQLLSIERRPITLAQNRIAKETEKKTALLQVSAGLLALKGAADTLSKPSFFNRTLATSNNESRLLASGDQIAATGSYSFSVRRLAQAHQLISNGYADTDTTAVAAAAGKIRIEIGGGYLDNATPLSFLNGQGGIDRGAIRVTDSQNKTGVINLEGAVTVQDVVDLINNNTVVNVRASTTGDRIVVEDLAGGSPTAFKIENYGGDTTATDLGIVGTGTSVGGKNYIFGSDINFITNTTSASLLNDGLGVRKNADGISDFRITDTDGTDFEVDLREADTTVLSVINRINNAAIASGSSLRAELNTDGTGIQLTDGAGAQGITVSGMNGGYAAVDLGFGRVSGSSFVQVSAEDSTTGLQSATGNLLVGNRLIATLNSRLRNNLNGGMGDSPASDVKGIREGSIKITDRDGDNITMNISSRVQTTLASGIAIGQTSALLTSVDGFAVGNVVRFAGGGNTRYRTITRISGNAVYFNEALDAAFANGSGVHANNQSVGDIVNVINDRSPVSNVDVGASINAAGNGLLILDTSGGVGTLSVSGAGGSFAAADLGISSTVSANSIVGGDIDPQTIGENTLLSTLNSGKGVYAGEIQITDTAGKIFTVDLSQSDDTTIFDVLDEIDAAALGNGSGVRARINDAGNGIYLEDTTPGAGTLKVEEIDGGRTARDLNIEGSAEAATPTIIDGTFEREIDILAGSTLDDVAKAINDEGLNIFAAVLNDGSGINPYRLSILSKDSGRASRLTIETDISGLSFTTTANAQDAVLLYGTDGSAMDPVLISSSSNSVKDVVKGLTLDLMSAGEDNVTVNVSRDRQGVIDQVQRFTETYNDAVDQINEFTTFDPDTFVTGTLFSESVIRSVERMMGDMITRPVTEIQTGNINNLGAVGVKMTETGKLTFDSSKLSDALTTSYDQVRDLFTWQKRLSLDTKLTDLNNGLGVDAVSGDDFKITLRNGVSTVSVDLGSADTLADVIDAINFDSENAGKITASIAPDGFSLRLVDNTSPTAKTNTVTSGTTTTFVDPTLSVYADDFLNGATITFLEPGTNYLQVRTVQDFDSATGTVTLDTALPAAVAANDDYQIERAFEVAAIGSNTSASQLKIEMKLDLGRSILTGGLLNLKGDPGVGFRVSEQLDFITSSTDGMISRRTDGIDDVIDGYNKDVERMETRLQRLEERLVREFTQLEIFLSQSQATMSRLQSQLSGMVSLAQSSGSKLGS